MSRKDYIPLDSEDDDPVVSDNKSSVSSDLGSFTITVLNKEKSYPVPNMTVATKLIHFKQAVKNVTNVEVSQQRLIYAGRRLDGDDKPLNEFKVTGACTIHLFPIPIASVVPTATASTTTSQATEPNDTFRNPLHRPFGNDSVLILPSHTPMHFDDMIAQSSREVKLWSLILIFLSAMTLVEIFTSLITDDVAYLFGDGIVHTIVTFMNFVCSVGGVYVAQLGLNSARSLDLQEINKYIYYLRYLAIITLLMRILWVFDIVQTVQHAVDEDKKKAAEDTQNGITRAPSIHYHGGDEPLDDNIVHSFTIQASLICMICTYAWATCVVRAYRLQDAVQNYAEPTPPAQATAV